MSEDVARAVGAEDPEDILINGKPCRIRALSIKELTEVERDCLKQYKRQYLETFSENADLLPESDRIAIIKQEMERAARWDVADLPLRYAYDPDSLKINSKLADWARTKLDFRETDVDEKPLPQLVYEIRLKRVLSTALDSGAIKPEEYTEMAGKEPRKLKISYVNWWITASPEGMIAMIYASVKDQGISKKELVGELSKNPTLMVNLSREIEHLSAPKAGNG